MLTRFIRIQLLLFTILTIIALIVLGVYYLRLPSVVGIGQYHLNAELPRSGGLYATANVTYRGTRSARSPSVEPTERGARATMRSTATSRSRPTRRERALGVRDR